MQAMGPVQAECQTLFVWRDACGPQLATDILSDMTKIRLFGLPRIRKKPNIYPLSLEKTLNNNKSVYYLLSPTSLFAGPFVA
jgi:hypothetical protein